MARPKPRDRSNDIVSGWPAEGTLCQDINKYLSRWFASRPGARWQVRQVCEYIEMGMDTTPMSRQDALATIRCSGEKHA